MCRLVICVNCVSVFADLVAEEDTGGLSSFVGNAVILVICVITVSMCRLVICVNCVSVFADLVAEEDTGGLSSFVGNAVILVICVITVSMCRLVICVNCVSVFADLVAEEETGGLSSFVGNAVMLGDPCAWHVDANPASFPPSSPWVESFGFYYNRCGWVLLQQVWMGSTTTGVDGCG